MGDNRISRRDFLKLLALVPASISVRPLSQLVPPSSQPQPHIIIIVYDAWAARNTSIYGYPRETMPNLEKFAKKALVYHRHYAAGNFTVPGTASLLTGVYPWKHRAFALGGKIIAKYQNNQIFGSLNRNYDTYGYSQNIYADLLLGQSGSELHHHISNNEFNLSRQLAFSLPLFDRDTYVAFSSIDKTIFTKEIDYDGSLILGPIIRTLSARNNLIRQKALGGIYQNGKLPDTSEQFLLSNVSEGVIRILKNLTKPSLVYLHLYPPHEPYRPLNKYSNYFTKGKETLIPKPVHPLSETKHDYEFLTNRNRTYDQYLVSWDSEASKIYDYINSSGLRDKSYIFLTSDHGEMFERGEKSHMTPLLNQPVVHIPLIVSYPGITERKDIFSTTSAVDILPTIAEISNFPKPEWTDGQVLPGLGGISDQNRGVFSMEAKLNSSHSLLKDFSLSLTKNNKRFIYYRYNNSQTIEYYDLDQDPEELTNLYPDVDIEGKKMKEELVNKVAEISSPLNL